MNHFKATSIDSLIDNYIIVFSGLALLFGAMLLIRGIDRLINWAFRWSPLDALARAFFRQ